MNLINGQNLIYAVIGVLLIVTMLSVTQIRGGGGGKLPSKASVQTPVTPNNPALKGQNSTLIEPGLYQVQFPEQFAFAPEKMLIQLAPNASAPYYRYQSSDNISTYEISYVRFPDETFQQKASGKILDDLTEGEISRFQGVLKKESTVNESSNLIKREFEIESAQNGLYVRSMLILNRPYIYLVCYTSKNKSNLYSARIQSFFDSFKLFEQVAPQTIIVSSQPPKEVEQGNNLLSNPSNTGNSSLNLPNGTLPNR